MRTLEDINAELEQVRQKLDRAWKLSAVMEDLKAQHEERKRAAEEALKEGGGGGQSPRLRGPP